MCGNHQLKGIMKLSAVALAAALVAAPLLVAPAAQASTDRVTICHATSAANGKYNLNEVDKNSIITSGHGAHELDIIPAFSWVENKVRHYFEGQNLDKVGLIALGCKEPTTPGVVTINAPVYVPASCARPSLPYGEVVVPADKGQGIESHTKPALNTSNTVWSTAYQLKQDTEENTYAWPAGQTGQFEFTVVPITEDPMWVVDSKTGVGQCEMPETGAGEVLTWGAIGAAALGAGLLINYRARRRNS